MCGVVAEGSSRICQQQHPAPQTTRTTGTTNNTGMVIHGLGSVRTMTNSQEEVHRRWWWRRSPGMEPQSSSSSSGQAVVSQPQHDPHSDVDNNSGSSSRCTLHQQEHQKHPASSRLSSSPDDAAAMSAEVLITSRRTGGTTCSSLNKTYSRSSRPSSGSSRSVNNGDDSSNYELGSREQELNSVNERLCTDTLEKHLSACNEYSSLESGCHLGLRYRTSRKASSDSVEKSSMYSDESRRFSLINKSVMASKEGPITKSKCCSSIRHSSNIRRFCGLSSQQWIVAVTLLFLASFTGLADACSSRSTPKPRPASPTSRPNVTFLTYACPPAYAAWYCLNGATCFTVKIGDSILYNCECADGYMGQRCEFKDLDGSYLPARDKVLLQTASIAGGATLAVVLVFIVLFSLYVVRQRDKENKFEAEDSDRKPFSGYQNLRSESLCINNPYVQIEDLSDVKVVPSSGKNFFHGEDCSNIKSIICNNMNVGSDMISASAASNNTNSINSLHTPS